MKDWRWTLAAGAPTLRLRDFIRAQVPDLSPTEVDRALRDGRVQVGKLVERSAARRVGPGDRVDARLPGSRDVGAAQGRTLLRGLGWAAVDKPSGVVVHDDGRHGRSPEWIARLFPDGATAVATHRLDRGTSGVLVVATDEDALRAWSRRFEQREVHKLYHAIVGPGPRGASGELEGADADGRPMHLRWSLLRRSVTGDRAELAVEPREGRTHQIRKLLAQAGTPIVGDNEYGRSGVGAAPRLALHHRRLRWDGEEVEAPLPSGWDELLEPPAADTPAPGLRISDATVRILGKGHPWVLRDRDTGRTDHLRVGTVVELKDRRGEAQGMAVIDASGDLCARVLVGDAPRRWTERARLAVERRRSLLESMASDCVRLVHGEADGLPGLLLDRWAEVLVATLTGPCAEPMVGPAVDAARLVLGPLPCYVQQHYDDLRARPGGERGAALPGRWWDESGAATEGQEWGLRYRIDPIGTLSTGLYPDQRDNRRVVLESVAGLSVANLFGHTGAFSVAALRGGAARVETVDASGPWLTQAEANITRNALPWDRHTTTVAAASRWAERDGPAFDLIVVDPPAFARGRGAQDWSARRDLGTLLAALRRRLNPTARLLVCVNHKDLDSGWLRGQIEHALADARPALRRAAPSPDRPDLPGFPEGRAFVGWWAECRPPRPKH